MEDKIGEMLARAGPDAHLSTINGPRAHRLVMRQAKEFCGALYEKYAARWPGFTDQWPSSELFAKKFWPHFCTEARATLSQILGTSQNEALKEQIYDALIKDQSLVHTRENVPQVRMDL